MKREEQIQQSKQKIINAALNEFGQNDYFTASTNSICKNNGISKGLLFHYYSSKDEIFMVCVKKCFDELSQYIEEHIYEYGNNVEENLTKYMECRVEFFKLYPFYKKIFYTAVFNSPPHLVEEVEAARERLNQVNELFLIKQIDNLKLKDDVNKDEIIKIIMDFINFILSKHRITENAGDNFMKESDKEVIQMIKMLFYGIVQQ